MVLAFGWATISLAFNLHPQLFSLEFVSNICTCINLSVCIFHGNYLVDKMGLGQAEQKRTLFLHVISCLYCAVQPILLS